MVKRKLGVTLILLIAGTVFASDRASSKDATFPSMLTGDWTLDPERSARPPANGFMGGRGEAEPPSGGHPPHMGGPRGGGFDRGGGMGGRGGGMGRGGPMEGGFGSMPSREEIEAMRAIMREALNPPARMRIVQSDTKLTVSGEDEYRLVLDLTGRKAKSGNGVERKARWRKGQLVEEIKVAMSTIKRTYSLVETDSGKDLVIAVRAGHRDFVFFYVPATTTPAESMRVAPSEP
ncbi:MAG: hypothetical protein JXO72_16820 [Vicinamibacteria bacterium]|nr:hypothetical protein [Vicinamibacteria bacterium]